MTVTINGTNGLTFNDNSTQTTAATGFGFKNRIINGAMRIDQRNAGASVTPNNSYIVDRWNILNSQTSKLTVQRSTTAPSGFTNSALITSSSAYSVLTGDYFTFTQPIEGFNVADFAWGTANAATVTLSFWVRSSLTGTFGGAFTNGTRSYPFTYSISSANTFEYKTITIAGDTSGTWATDNSAGIVVRFGLGAGATFSGTAGAWATANLVTATGAVSVVGTNGATFYITGVQLEKGSTATSFDYRPYSTELQLCQRYLPCFNFVAAESVGPVAMSSTTIGYVSINFPVQTRVAPTGISVTNPTNFTAFTSTTLAVTNIAIGSASTYSGRFNITVSGATAGHAGILQGSTGSSQIQFTGCEL